MEEIIKWREHLAKNIAVRNESLTVDEINEAVQRILDRLIFIRNLEDREIIGENTLFDITKKKENLYHELLPLFSNLNVNYNGLLFKPHFSEKLALDDKVLNEIIQDMCYPKSPFQFDVIEPEILGRIYEKFLGSKIRLTDSHRAKVEEKEEVRHAGGVYYTPQFIVDYIVKETVGKKLTSPNSSELDKSDPSNPLLTHSTSSVTKERVTGLTPDQVAKIKILDPACGSGSFLLGAYHYLMEYHRKFYSDIVGAGHARSLRKYKDDFFINPEGEVKLTIKKKGEILVNNIYGVDIDREANEVAILSLYLKLLEHGIEDDQGWLFMKGKVLPDMTNNIKCGNSLIEMDYFEGRLDFDIQEMKEIRPFDWKNEFKEIFSNKGFDCVIGNPPYVRQEILGEKFKKYAKNKYKTFSGTADLYVYFIEKSLSLLNPEGLYSVIVANKWMRANYGKALRIFLKNKKIFEIIDFGDLPVFKGATTYPCIIKANNEPSENFEAVQIKSLEFSSLEEVVSESRYKVDINSLDDKGWSLSNQKESALLDKIKKAGITLGEYVNGKIYYGIKTGLNEAFVIDEEAKNRLIKENKKSEQLLKPYLRGRDIQRYSIISNGLWLIFTLRNTDILKYPAIEKHLNNFKQSLMPGAKGGRAAGSYPWFVLQSSPSFEDELNKKKIILPAIVNRATAAYDEVKYFGNDKTTFIASTDLILIAILNSSLITFFYKNIASTKQGGYFEQKPMYISQIPIPNSPHTEIKESIEKLVEQMLSSQKELQSVKTETDKNLLQKKCEMIDNQIDKLVYELYGLTEEEIQIVVGNAK